MTMGEKILNMRKARGWNQEELAERIGVTRQAVSRWEAGSAKPDADKLLLLSNLFLVSTDYLLRDDMETDATKQEVSDGALPLTAPGRRKIYLCLTACLILGCVLAAACFRPPRDIHEVLEQKRFEIQGQVEWDVSVVLDVTSLPDAVFSGETIELAQEKYTVYEWENSKLGLAKVWKPSEDLYALMFCFTHDLPREGPAITTTFANLGEGTYTNKVRIQDENLYSGSLVYQDALQFAGVDAYGFTVYIHKAVLEQVEGQIEFTVNGLNRLVYKRDR